MAKPLCGKIPSDHLTLSGGGDMRVYLVQHGEAKPETEDPERPLTVKGAEEIKRVSGAAKKLPWSHRLPGIEER